MQYLRNAILRHVRVIRNTHPCTSMKYGKFLTAPHRNMCASSVPTGEEALMAQVIGLVKKFDKIDASKVTEMADFQKDLCLDSLDRVELVMALEQEFSIEIPEEKADKLTCCSDVVHHLLSEVKVSETP
ncbi:hypothetical protein QJS04_geneDACA005288 [Acorus gramineus]|uniref:Acyl carrier protein n=1 Tax=Acorus gramineus TaxID=55184 RepID=A0AAV9AWQ3_ACOGR|nr:hypothetical protein QJS04_geneDACA005288 [Acorus gramineus]